MASIVHRILARFYLSDHVPDLLKQGRAAVKAIEGKAEYPNPTPTPAQVTAALDDLEAAEIQAKTRAVGAVQARNTKKLLVISLLRQLEAYVQFLADNDLSNAASLITGASMSLRKASTRKKPELAATYDAALALVYLVGRAAKGRAFYEWEWSTDQQNWNSLPRTLAAKTSFAGATPMTTYFFRFRAITKAGTGDWSAVISLFVR